MAKLQDGSERIRIKVDLANKIREMADGLNMTFLEVVYYGMNTFYLHHYAEMQRFKSQPQTVRSIETQEDSLPETLKADSNDTCEIDLDI